MATDKTIVMAVRVPRSLMRTMRAVALANRRPFGMQVNVLLEEGLKALGVPLPDEFAADPDKDDDSLA